MVHYCTVVAVMKFADNWILLQNLYVVVPPYQSQNENIYKFNSYFLRLQNDFLI